MQNLGESLTGEDRERYVEGHLTPGSVVKLFCNLTKPRPKEKFLVIVSLQPELLMFLINSELNSFRQNQPSIRSQQISISQADHPFLSHDSWIDCSAVWKEFTLEHLRAILLTDVTKIQGRISKDVKVEVMTSVSDSLTLEQRYIERIIVDLD